VNEPPGVVGWEEGGVVLQLLLLMLPLLLLKLERERFRDDEEMGPDSSEL